MSNPVVGFIAEYTPNAFLNSAYFIIGWYLAEFIKERL